MAISVLACLQQLSSTASAQAPERDARYFAETGFRIDDDKIWDYFKKRGGTGTFGLPTSRTFQFQGSPTQFFQRQVVQVGSNGVHTLNLLDDGLLPYTTINGSTFPAVDPSVVGAAPRAGSADYGTAVIAYLKRYAPNTFEGQPVGFYDTFLDTVTLDDAFPNGGGNADLLPLLNLEIWGLPTSKPARDPKNNSFVYLRFQRGIMHYDESCKCTQGLLLGDALKELITGQNLPDDLAQQASQSPLFKQYDVTTHSGPLRPSALTGSNLADAFRPSLDTATAASAPPAAPTASSPKATATAPAATSTPSSTAAAGGNGPTATPESPLQSGGAGSAPQASPLGDLSAFRTITQDTLDKLNAGDQKGATARIRDLETAWDRAEATLKPKSPAEWTKIDDKIDEALRQLRAVNPNPAAEKTALQDLLDVLK
ncbi:MAG: hypothetical protein U0893_14230 [Chloroflexota bacterium]